MYDECDSCGRPSLLHQEGDCTRTVEETADVVVKNWSDGIERLITKIHGQNTSNMSLYNQNMTTLVQSLNKSIQKTWVKEDG